MRAVSALVLSMVSILGSVSSFAASSSGDASTDIMNNPSIKAVATLMSEKYGRDCQGPSKREDINWMCTGALRPGPQPKITQIGCAFHVSVQCGPNSASIIGRTHQYGFKDSNGTYSETPEMLVTIESISFVDAQYGQ